MYDPLFIIWLHFIAAVFIMMFVACIIICYEKIRRCADDRQPNANLSSTSSETTIPMTSMEETARRRCNSYSDTDTPERDLYNNTPPPAYDDVVD
ncbi:hypothetical protein CDAR_571721 [Caerostris darwini]|uniref:Uncharacterized protein n=1 Tax=Caerostris darwini TaxID=1538125 RepID=A0AAV4MHS9_9ARAC|nr:hypothetical protein CDAR_571721 [Caerostris darwini]